MKLKNLLKNAKTLGLAGILALGVSSTAKADDSDISGFASDNGYIIETGVNNSSSNWSPAGSQFNNSGIYTRIGHGFSDRITAYAELRADNPVIRDGLIEINNPDNKFNVSPNHYTLGFGVGARANLPLNENKDLHLCSELRFSRLSEFDDSVKWKPNKYSDVHVDGITAIDSSFFLQKAYNSFTFRGGININSSYASGKVLTHTIESPTRIDTLYSDFNQRNKLGVDAIFGIDYDLSKDITLKSNMEIGRSFGIGLGFNKRW